MLPLLAFALACTSGPTTETPPGDQPVLVTDAAALQPTVLHTATVEGAPAVLPLRPDETGPPTIDPGSGLQILQVSPLGSERESLQAAVVFDRPMVPLADLDTMTSAVPLSCTGPGVVRWAGTTTAVFRPEGDRFPRASTVTCSVPAGTAALDGTPLENTVAWTFETLRPALDLSSPPNGHSLWDPDEPVVLVFNQAVEPREVAAHLHLSADADGAVLSTSVDRPEPGSGYPGDRAVTVTAPLTRDTAYTLTVGEGVRGSEGTLASTEPVELGFRTYPPLRVVETLPTGAAQIDDGLSIEFSTPVQLDDVGELLTISPEPADGHSAWGYTSTRWWHQAALAPRTTYTVTLAAGLTDEHGQRLDTPTTWTFSTGDEHPRLHVPQYMNVYAANNPLELPLRHKNVSAVNVRVAPLDPQVLLTRDTDDAVTLAVAGATTLSLPTEDVPNTWEVDTVDLAPYLSEHGTGVVAIESWSPEVTVWDAKPYRYRAVLQVTDLGVSLKVEPGATTAWVTRLSDGSPVAGADVTFFREGSQVATAVTDTDGLARATGTTDLAWRPWDHPLWVRVRTDDDQVYAQHRWSSGLQPWAFGIWADFTPSGRTPTSHTFTDRGIYRPGDTFHARTTFRHQTAAGLELPGQAKVSWQVHSPRGEVVVSGDGELDTRGGFSVTADLPEDGPLGTYQLQVSADGDEWSDSSWTGLPVRAYRAPAFRVDVDAPEDATAGTELRAHVQARYLFGAPMRGVEADWSVWREPAWFSPDGWDGWSFGPERPWWREWDAGGDTTEVLSSGTTTTGDDGQLTVVQVVPPESVTRPWSYQLEATVTDKDRQVIADRDAVLVHPADAYAGVRVAERLPTAGEPTSVEIVAVDHDGEALPRQDVTVQVMRRTWDRVRQKAMDGRWEYVNTPVDEEVAAQQVRTAAEPVSVDYTPDVPGTYVVSATVRDEAGRSSSTSETVYAVGGGYTGWAMGDDGHLELVPDQQTYAPGDVARILVKTPREGLRALITVEREGVLYRDVRVLDGTATTVEIPIDAAWMPNAVVSVLAIDGAAPQDSPDKGRPSVFIGMLELDVDSDTEHLVVDVTTDREVYGPGDTVEVGVTVEQGGEAIVGAGVSLYAVDESVLSLTAYETPDPFGTFYQDHMLSVLTADSRVRVLDRAAFLTKGANPGGGGGGGQVGGPAVRSRFLTTVAWEPDLRTGDDGVAHATFTLPDNLTTFRVMAVADVGATAFGSDDAELRVSRPLIARPALPRFLRSDDVVFAGVVVHNNTDDARLVEVRGAATGADLDGSPAKVSVPAHGALEVPFRLQVHPVDEVRLSYSVAAGEDRDAVERVLPVREARPREVVATTGSTTSTITERVVLPDGALPDRGGLDVEVASTALVGAGAGIDTLMDYPHACVEQRSSRALAALVALRIHDRAGIEQSEDELRAVVTEVLADLETFRVPNGEGLGYWPGSRHASPMGTAYAVELAGRVREQGFAVDDDLITSSSRYLRQFLAGEHQQDNWSRELSADAQAYALVALARAGQGDAGHNNRLYARRSELSEWGTASLLEAIARTTGPDQRTTALQQDLESRLVIEASSATVRTTDAGRWGALWGSDHLATAAVLEALLQANPGSPLAPRLAQGLVAAQRGGQWTNTRSTAGVLAALAAYADRYEGPAGVVPARVTLGDRTLLQRPVPTPGTASAHVARTDLQTGDLTVATDAGRLYYQARLEYWPTAVDARDEGFTVVRNVEVLEGGGAGGAVTAGTLLRVDLRVVTPVARTDVAITDPLPAGLELVDTGLATASQAPGSGGQDTGQDTGQGGRDTGDMPEYSGWWSAWVFDHTELRDDAVVLYASHMPAGVHTWQYVARATTPGVYAHPPTTAEEMYTPENFGRTSSGTFVVGVEQVAGE